MRILHRGAILWIILTLQACSGRYQTPISFFSSSNQPTPAVQKSPIVTPTQKVYSPCRCHITHRNFRRFESLHRD